MGGHGPLGPPLDPLLSQGVGMMPFLVWLHAKGWGSLHLKGHLNVKGGLSPTERGLHLEGDSAFRGGGLYPEGVTKPSTGTDI